MDDSRFDRLARRIAVSITRRGTLIGLASGLLAPLVSDGEAAASDGLALHVEKKKKKRKKNKRCKGGKTRCGKACGGGNPGTPGVCRCTKATCVPGQCGDPFDGCGGRLDCGGCEAPETCGGGGTANVCGCLTDGAETTVANREACCSSSCCFAGIPGNCVCAGGCG